MNSFLEIDSNEIKYKEEGFTKKTFIVIFSILMLIILVYILNKTTNNDSNKIINTENIETVDFEQYISSEIMIADFTYLVEKILEVHPDPKRNFEGDWNKVIDDMKKDFANPMPIGEYAMKLTSFTSRLNDAHTEVYPLILKVSNYL